LAELLNTPIQVEHCSGLGNKESSKADTKQIKNRKKEKIHTTAGIRQ
jgi:hypothetical protein